MLIIILYYVISLIMTFMTIQLHILHIHIIRIKHRNITYYIPRHHLKTKNGINICTDDI